MKNAEKLRDAVHVENVLPRFPPLPSPALIRDNYNVRHTHTHSQLSGMFNYCAGFRFESINFPPYYPPPDRSCIAHPNRDAVRAAVQ